MSRWLPLKALCVDAGQYGLNIGAEHYRDSGIRLIRTTDLSGARDDVEPVFVEGPLEPRHRLAPGDLLLSRSGTIGLGFKVGADAANSTFAGYLVKFRPIGEVDPRFLHYATQTSVFQAAVQAEAVSSTITNFNAERYANLQVPKPEPDEQRRIADFLDDQVARLDAAVAERQRSVALLADRQKILLDDRIEALTRSSGSVRFGRSIRGLEQGWSPQCDNAAAEPDEWGVVKVGCVRVGNFHGCENKRLPDDLGPLRRYEIRAGDLLFTRANTPELVGDVTVVPPGVRRRLLLCDKIIRVDLEGDLGKEFVAVVARTTRARAHLTASSSGTSQSMVNIRGADLRSLEIPAVSPATQQAVVSEIRSSETQQRLVRLAIADQVGLLTERKRALITAAVTGEFDVSSASTRATAAPGAL